MAKISLSDLETLKGLREARESDRDIEKRLIRAGGIGS